MPVCTPAQAAAPHEGFQTKTSACLSPSSTIKRQRCLERQPGACLLVVLPCPAGCQPMHELQAGRKRLKGPSSARLRTLQWPQELGKDGACWLCLQKGCLPSFSYITMVKLALCTMFYLPQTYQTRTLQAGKARGRGCHFGMFSFFKKKILCRP